MQEIIDSLIKKDIKLWTDGEKLKFDAARGAMTEDILKILRENKNQLISFIQNKTVLPKYTEQESRSGLPLSLSQKRLWFIEHISENSAVNNLISPVQLYGLLDIQILKNSFNRIVQRHDSLRSQFIKTSNQPQVKIIKESSWKFILLSEKDNDTWGDNEWHKYIEEISKDRLKIEEGENLKVILLKKSECHYIMIVITHHIISDSWSMANMIRELNEFYSAELKGENSEIEPLKYQYPSFSLLQNKPTYKEKIDEQIHYWKNNLHGCDFSLSISKKNNSDIDFTGEQFEILFEPHVKDSIKHLAIRHRVSEFTLIQAAFTLMMYYQTGKNDLHFGIDVANRTMPELEPMIGFFVNQLVLRNNIIHSESLNDFYSRIQNTSMSAYDNQDAPFDEVIRSLNVERKKSSNPLFNTKLVYQNVPEHSLKLPGIQTAPYRLTKHSAELEFVAVIWNTSDSMGMRIEYQKNIFNQKEIESIASRFITILKLICESKHHKTNELIQNINTKILENSTKENTEKSTTIKTTKRKPI